MKKKDKDYKKNLLPQGFYDLTSNSAFDEVKLNFSILERLNDLEYHMISPAMLEFEEFLDKNFSSELFKVTDPISGKMLAIRNDITPQISRIFEDKYSKELEESKFPLKLSYSGRVLKKYGKGKFQERQLTQTGFEIVGTEIDKINPIKDVIEIFNLININNFTLDFSIPNLSEVIFTEMGLDKKEAKDIQKNIEEKNISSLKNNNGDKYNKITKIVECYEKVSSAELAIKAVENISKLIESETAKNLLSDLKSFLQSSDGFDISLNLLEKSGFDYHQGTCFSVISKESYEELGRGGRYIIKTDDRSYSAVGFTFMLDSILRLEGK